MGGWRWEFGKLEAGGWKWEGGELDDDKRLAVEGVAAISLVFPAGFLAISLESICVLIINWIYRPVTVQTPGRWGSKTYWRVDLQPLETIAMVAIGTSGLR